MVSELNRRQALALLAAAGATTACSQPTEHKTPDAADTSTPFRHGVASGDPLTDSVVIWTRVTTESGQETVAWEMAKDADFQNIIFSGETQANAAADHTVKVIVGGLEAGKTYFYRFALGEKQSITGRTKTLPAGSLEKLGIALASCSNYAFGFFNAYDAIAKDESIDFVLHTGDYIYEYGGEEGWGHETAKVIGRVHMPEHEIITLADYRMRHAQYKTDAGSIAMHAAHPMIACWDDHESANNPWKDGAQNHQPDTEGDWGVRRAAALQAYYEWQPIREPEAGKTRAEFWRSYAFGDLATLITLETRHTARGEQVDYGKYFDTIKTQEDRDSFMADVMNDPSRKMISEGMEDEIRNSFGASVASGQPWRLFGNASPIARMLVPDVLALGIDPSHQSGGGVPGAGADMFWKGKWNLPFYTDTWDGYPVAREELYDLCRGVGASDLVFLTGDSHSFWANSLFDEEGQPVGIELGTAGISSPGDFVESGWDEETSKRLDALFAEQLDEVEWTDNMHQGYVRVVMTPDELVGTFVGVDTVLKPEYKTLNLKTVRVIHKDGSLVYA